MDNVAEKLNIDKEKIIHILLKHLMLQRNELAYLNNKVGLNNADYSNTDKHIGINNADGSNTEKHIGINNTDGSNTVKQIGINSADKSSMDKQIGINNADESSTDKHIGINNIVYALSTKEGTANRANGLYSVFEQKLINALEQYIKNGTGQNSLFNYYSDFEQAVAETNSLADKLKDALNNLRIEDTHILPTKLSADNASLSKLEAALYGHLPHNSKHDLYYNVALEMLLLHNTGMAKQTTLREITGLSVSGFSKHLPRLIQFGLIKELPSKNYALTEKSKHILLETFGVEKSK